MIDRLLVWSIEYRLFVVALALALVGAGAYAALDLPIDAVPDLTNNQVQINTKAAAFTPLEIEQYVTAPIEAALASLPHKQDVRSISQFGLSQVTVVFEDGYPLSEARRQTLERLIEAQGQLPEGLTPELAPVSTGLGEIVQFTLEAAPQARAEYGAMELRTLLDWFIKPRLRELEGVIEVNSYGGLEKQYEVLLDPALLVAHRVSVNDVVEALKRNNQNVGGGYLERGGEQRLLRGVGLVNTLSDLENIAITANAGTPVLLRALGSVRLGSELRQGAATRDGRGETVLGVVMMLKGANSRAVAERVVRRLDELNKALPPGVRLDTFYDRRDLVDRTIKTALSNLVEGGLIVIAVLFLFLLQWRAGLIVSTAIPLAMLVAVLGMRYFHISANLMSLGAIDFGLIVDAAVILVENAVCHLAAERTRLNRPLTPPERRAAILAASLQVRRASQFGEILIIAAYLPTLSLAGLEGKTFEPMGFTVILALAGALVLSLTFIPALCALFLQEPRRVQAHASSLFERYYTPALSLALARPRAVVAASVALLAVSAVVAAGLGSEFLPKLEEGALAISAARLPGVSLDESIRLVTAMEKTLAEAPEVQTTVTRIGRPEIATDPMGVHLSDTYVLLKPRAQWPEPLSREQLVERLEQRLHALPAMSYLFSQPIEFRMMELIEGAGSRSDLVVKISGDDLGLLRDQAERTARVLSTVPGIADLKVQQVEGQPMVSILPNRAALGRHAVPVADVQQLIQTAIVGTPAGRVFEGFKRFALMVRLEPSARASAEDFSNLPVATPAGAFLPLGQLAELRNEEGPLEISRENGQRRITIEANVRGRDIGSVVDDARARVEASVRLEPGYLLTWGGLFEHLDSGRARLLVVSPLALLLIFALLYATFRSLRLAVLVLSAVPFAATGGVLLLAARGMPFSMSAGVGFLAVSGVAVLNGVVLVSFFEQHRATGQPLVVSIRHAALDRLRAILTTASVASLGFLPMALSSSAGAEVQRPLATVVLGGVASSTLLTLLVLPALLAWLAPNQD